MTKPRPMVFDKRLAGQRESIYQARDMVRRRQLAGDALGAAPGERIADVGCGPGFCTAELLAQRQLDADGGFFFGCIQFCFSAIRPPGRTGND